MGEAIQQSAGEPLGVEDLGPLRHPSKHKSLARAPLEGQVAGDQCCTSFIAQAEDLEEQFGSGPG